MSDWYNVIPNKQSLLLNSSCEIPNFSLTSFNLSPMILYDWLNLLNLIISPKTLFFFYNIHILFYNEMCYKIIRTKS